MAEKKRRLAKFIGEHPYCCLCGGNRPADTIEHAPPKVIFWDKQRAKGLEVPACKRCNHNSSQSDQLAAFYALVQSSKFYSGIGNNELVSYFEKIGRGCKNNIPDFTNLIQDEGSLNLLVSGKWENVQKISFNDRLFKEHLNPWSVKQALAHWYDTYGTIFSDKGRIVIRWLTNYELLNDAKLEPFLEQFGELSNLRQGIKNNDDQFYIRFPKTNHSERLHVMYALYHGTAFIAAMVDDPDAIERLEEHPLNLLEHSFRTSEQNGIQEWKN